MRAPAGGELIAARPALTATGQAVAALMLACAGAALAQPAVQRLESPPRIDGRTLLRDAEAIDADDDLNVPQIPGDFTSDLIVNGFFGGPAV